MHDKIGSNRTLINFCTTMQRIYWTLLLTILMTGKAFAAVQVSISQVGSNVEAVSSGTINTAVCTSTSNASLLLNEHSIDPASKVIGFGVAGGLLTRCNTTITAPTAFGSGSYTVGSSGGTSFYLYPSGFWGPRGFTSSTSFANTMTFANSSISSLGLTPGVYQFTFSNGGISDTFTLTVNSPSTTPAAIPTLSEWAMLLMASLMAVFAYIRIRSRRS